jgi:hypothetical protein
MLVLFKSVDHALSSFVIYVNVRAVSSNCKSAAVHRVADCLVVLVRVFMNHGVLELVALVDCPGNNSTIGTDSEQLLFDLGLLVSGRPPAHTVHWIRQVLVLDVEQCFAIYGAYYLQLSICKTDCHHASIMADPCADDLL